MGNQLNKPILVSSLADSLGLTWFGEDLEITNVVALNSQEYGSLSYSKLPLENRSNCNSVVIAPPGNQNKNSTVIEAENPRLEFAKALLYIDKKTGFSKNITPVKLGTNVKISPSAIIENGTEIGDRCVIGHNVIISGGVKIGNDTEIKSNTVIGESGFGFERDESGIPLRILHLGSVRIGCRVEIGSLNTVCRGTLDNTIIEDDVKTDDHVHIAHNCWINKGSIITACVELSGSVKVGKNVWVGPNSSIIQKVNIGDNSFVGIASNVTKSVAPDTLVAGNPARSLPNRKKH